MNTAVMLFLVFIVSGAAVAAAAVDCSSKNVQLRFRKVVYRLVSLSDGDALAAHVRGSHWQELSAADQEAMAFAIAKCDGKGAKRLKTPTLVVIRDVESKGQDPNRGTRILGYWDSGKYRTAKE